MPGDGPRTYRVEAHRLGPDGSLAWSHGAEVPLATGPGAPGASLNPVELLLAALAACIIKGIERVVPILRFDLAGVEVDLAAVRRDVPPGIASVRYEIRVDTGEDDRRLELLHRNVRRYGTIFNTLAAATDLDGRLLRTGAGEHVAVDAAADG